MIIVKRIFIILMLLVVPIVAALGYDLSSPSLDFSSADAKKIISIETETQPILVSYSIAGDIKKYIEVSANKNMRVTKTEPLILTIEAKNPTAYKEGSIMINTIYEELPEDMNDYSDDTVLIPIRLSSQVSSPEKLYITFSEPTKKESNGVALGADVIMPIAVMVVILFILKRKWKK